MVTAHPVLLALALFAIGLAIGAYAPLALFYMFTFIRRGHLGYQLIKQSLLRLAAILFVFMVLFASSAVLMNSLGYTSDQLPDNLAVWLGAGIFFGLLGGAGLFVLGLLRGRRKAVAASPSAHL